ncbi:hypothetical protein EDD11_000867 [Mortierella claussenii]|nr:hypothetical protein EDD11_000867 [Mortierella claussenii]
MLRPLKLLTVLLACCLCLFTAILTCSSSSSPSSATASFSDTYTPRRPSFLRSGTNTIQINKKTDSCQSSQQSQQQQQQANYAAERSAPSKVARQVKPTSQNAISNGAAAAEIIRSPKTSLASQEQNPEPSNVSNRAESNKDQHYGSKRMHEGDTRYLMYIPYAGVTNQLISIWHGSLIAKALNRTLLLPNLSPNVHVETSGEQVEPAPTRWSEFFDLDHYSQMTGLKIEELDTFLAKRGIVERSTVSEHTVGSSKRKKRSLEDDGAKLDSSAVKRKMNKKRWIQLGSPIESKDTGASQPFHSSPPTMAKPSPVRSVKFPAVQKCFSEAGYGADRRIDMTGRRFQQRYNIDQQLIPTPFLDPENDSKTIWSRWRMDKVVERYQQPEYDQQEILCLGHVYRLLPGGTNRAWVEFGQHFRYTDKVHEFVDEILGRLLPLGQKDLGNVDTVQEGSVSLQPFVGVHLRRGDFHRHCLGITSPADPNGWNRCYPSTEHIVSLLDTYSRNFQSLPSITPSTPPLSILPPGPSFVNHVLAKRQDPSAFAPVEKNDSKLPVLVLTNERDPEELAKADAQNWIRVDHDSLGTLERFGRYGPILIDGALLARASVLVGVEYSTYFKTASKRAETWYGGRTLFVI